MCSKGRDGEVDSRLLLCYDMTKLKWDKDGRHKRLLVYTERGAPMLPGERQVMEVQVSHNGMRCIIIRLAEDLTQATFVSQQGSPLSTEDFQSVLPAVFEIADRPWDQMLNQCMADERLEES